MIVDFSFHQKYYGCFPIWHHTLLSDVETLCQCLSLTRCMNWTWKGKIPSYWGRHWLSKLPNYGVQLPMVSQKTLIGTKKMSTNGQCDNFMIIVPMLELNSNGISTSGKIFIEIVSNESLSYRCCDSEAPISCYTESMSFGDKISSVGFEFLSPKGFSIQVLLWGLDVSYSVWSVDTRLLSVEDGGHSLNWPKV